MNTVYIILNRKLTVNDAGYISTYGKLSNFLDQEVEPLEAKKIKVTFSKSGLDKNSYLSDNWIISKQLIIRKPKNK